ncbi:uncharacterized protein BP01DRAFT_349532 [Aspergillus saccharolyticus JOP 1030-1]|uniref:Uncharacterized protein n=1 Tax=Aspergillus saccharolyticus JOP 1030-1 TaxID=1450539 RepID=A0A319A1F3_9EURO|nr:hypothetical protein BP01DRAFT_349532 [Aspergillus saccharolyticus JOP 1030-1]PYH41322.1 hypothetical protein BP01DRAFT_349532 [Aspergillus saccharolyticus JOP 1030-1]
MRLTPIYVRGRRKRHTDDEDAPKPIASGPRGGRPLLSPQAKLTSSQIRSHKRARLLTANSTKSRKKKKKQSRLESLPNELIEHIFLYSLNVNFARASPVLAAAVSTERIYRTLILLAFWDDSAEASVSCNRESKDAIAKILRPLHYTPLSPAQRKDLQTAILHCRWCTVQRILDQLPKLMKLVIRRQWFGAGISMTDDHEGTLKRVLKQKDHARVFEGFEASTTSDTSTPTPTNNYTLTIKPLVSVTITNHSNGQETTHPFLSPLVIPDKYLRGSAASNSASSSPASSSVASEDGFSQALITYLEVNRLALGCSIDTLPLTPLQHPLALSRPALQQGIHTALIANNLPALLTLLKLDEYYFRVTEQQHITAQDQDPDQSPVLPYTLPAKHFRTAMHFAPRSPEFFQALVRASAESVPADDADITYWAMHLQDPFGQWLLRLMELMPEQTAAAKLNPVQNSVFWMGRANADRRELASLYLRDVLGGVERLDSWMGEVHLQLSPPSSS